MIYYIYRELSFKSINFMAFFYFSIFNKYYCIKSSFKKYPKKVSKIINIY